MLGEKSPNTALTPSQKYVKSKHVCKKHVFLKNVCNCIVHMGFTLMPFYGTSDSRSVPPVVDTFRSGTCFIRDKTD